MPHPPNHNGRRQPARRSKKSKHRRRTSPPRRSSSTVPRAESLAQCSPESEPIIEQLFSLSPLELLGLVLMLEMRDRITDAHLEALCNIYYTCIMYSGNYYD
jgi:hypothetical protein